MINNIVATEAYSSSRGWSRKVEWYYNGTYNTVECSSNNQYTELIKTLVDSQVDEKVPYSRVKYIKEKR